MDEIFSIKLINNREARKKGRWERFTLDLCRLDFFVVVGVIKVCMTRVNRESLCSSCYCFFFLYCTLSTGVIHLQQYPMDVLSLANVGDKFVKPVGDDQEDEMNFQEEVEDQPGADFFPDVENLDQVGKNEDYDEYEEKEDADDPNNKEYTNEKDTLDLDNQPSDETDKNKDSTENPIAPNSEGGNASSDAKEPATEQKYGPPDAFKDAKQQWEDDQKTASHTFIETKQQVEETQKTA